MRRPTILAAAFVLIPGTIRAQEPVQLLASAVQEQITQEGLERQARAIVEHIRPSGSPGENAAIDHVVATLRGDGMHVDVHTFEVLASDPVSASVELPRSGDSFQAITVSFSAPTQELVAPVVDVGTLGDLPGLEVGTGEALAVRGTAGAGAASRLLPDLSGRIALVQGQPRGAPTAVLAALGAVGVIFVNPEDRLNELIVTTTWGTPSMRNYARLPSVPVVEVERSAGEVIRARLARGPVQVRMSAEVVTGYKPLRLAVARIPAPDADAPFVLFGGHIDGWHHGATDEGASNAAMVELARAFHAQRGMLRRGLVVAWWPGHSNARYGGSTWFADHHFDELRRRAVAHVNVDGIGQRDANRYDAATTASLAGLASNVLQRGAATDVRPGRPGRNSDQSFNGIGLPLLQLYHSGPYDWWHTPDDTFDKIDFDNLEADTDLYADALAALLAAPVLPLDLVAQVEAVGTAMRARQEQSGGRLDLESAWQWHGLLTESVAQVQARIPGWAPSPELDLSLVALLRPLHRVLCTPLAPWHPDAGLVGGALPGLAPASILAEAEPGSTRFRLAEASLVRERNRLLEALDEALGRATAILRSR